jgi:hypothetical protein
MKEYIQRMVAEKKELESKIDKANKAIKNPPYGMDEKDKNYLIAQVGYMETYKDILERRIKYDSAKEAGHHE